MPRIPTPRPGRLDEAGIVDAFAHRMMYSVAKDEHTASPIDVHHALAYAVRDRLVERWFKTQSGYYVADAKRVYYLSLEFLLGRALLSNIVNLGARDAYTRALRSLGYDLEALHQEEWDAGLGNGGLGRLAACIQESAATLSLPFYGYGIRYEYGIFQQRIVDGSQVEFPDNWLRYGNPWEIPRPGAVFPVRFYGRSVQRRRRERPSAGELGGHPGRVGDGLRHADPRLPQRYRQHSAALVGEVQPRVRPRPLQRRRVRSGGGRQDALGEHLQGAVPEGRQYAGKELRLKQQYFFVSATLQDVLRRFRKFPARRLEDLPAKVAIQLNDTHPVLAIPELMRVLVDGERMPWDKAWTLTQAVFGYTNHTVLPEALETWPAELLQTAPAPPFRDHRGDRPALPLVRGGGGGQRRAAPQDGHSRGRRTGAHGPPGLRGQPFRQRRGGAAHTPPEGSHIRRPRSTVPRTDQQQDQRHHPATLAPPGQPGPRRPGHRSDRRWLDDAPRRVEEAGADGGRRDLPWEVGRTETRQQDRPGRATPEGVSDSTSIPRPSSTAR